MAKRLTREEQIQRMTEVHGNRYSYKRWGHPKTTGKSTITCKDHGDFEQLYANHVNGSGCLDCSKLILSKAISERWQDPEFREMMAKVSSENMSKLWQDPKHREKMAKVNSENMSKLWQDPEFQEKISNNLKEKWQDPEFREIQSKAMSEKWQDPEFKEMMSNTISKGEAEVFRVLTEVVGYQEGVDFEREKNIPDTAYRFDFYLIAEDMIIEVHGIQHYTGWGGKEENLRKKQHNDKVKKDWAELYGHGYIVIPYRNNADLNNIESILLGQIGKIGKIDY